MLWMVVVDRLDDVTVGFVESDTPEGAVEDWTGKPTYGADDQVYVVPAEHVIEFEAARSWVRRENTL